MAVDVIMPQMGESIFEGTITKWLKKAGDKIERDEPLFEISTDKVDAEIPSPSAGVLKEIKVNEGQTVPIQTVVAVIDADGAAAGSAAPAASAPAKPEAAKPAPAPVKAQAPSAPAAKSASPAVQPPAAANGEKVRSSPLVRKIAREHNIDVSQVPGTGAGGRVSKHDILNAVEGGAGAVRTSAQVPASERRAECCSGSAVRPSSGSGRRIRIGRSRKRGSARKDVLRPLRSSTDVRDAPAHRRAHGALEARFAARLFCRRGGHDRDRHPARQNEE